jgi:hypothetical protein
MGEGKDKGVIPLGTIPVVEDGLGMDLNGLPGDGKAPAARYGGGGARGCGGGGKGDSDGDGASANEGGGPARSDDLDLAVWICDLVAGLLGPWQLLGGDDLQGEGGGLGGTEDVHPESLILQHPPRFQDVTTPPVLGKHRSMQLGSSV